MKIEHDDDYRDEEYQETDERDEFGSRSIFAAGWFRAALVLTVLAIVLVISYPYLLNLLEPAPSPKTAKTEPARPIEQTGAPTPAPSVAAPGTAQAPATPPAPRPAPPVAAPQVKPAPDVPVATAPPVTRNRAERPAAAKSDDRPSPPRSAKTESPATAAAASDKQERYWVQLGAFRDAANAEALARSVRSAGFAVQVSEVSRGNATTLGRVQRHELFVTQARAEKVGAALKGRGRAESAPGGVVVKPAFSLEDAMSVSRQLTADGFNVVIRPASVEADNTVHVVRAGGYSDRARAAAARDALKTKGHDGFVAEGPAR